VDIEHCDFLSWFSERGESHEQDGERLHRAGKPSGETASSDPAMAFGPSIERTGDARLEIGSTLAAGCNSG
jgi:hypothetical protein